MSKLAWVLLPLVLLLLGLLAAQAAGRRPSRPLLNALFSLLLLGYLATTAGLGLFWVANQQLPVFDWHYLFGYATLAALAIHLLFNLRTLVAQLGWRRRTKPAAGAFVGERRDWLGTLAGTLGLAALGGGIGYVVGLRHGRTELVVAAQPTAAGTDPGAELVRVFHDYSGHRRRGVWRQAPSVDWGDPPAPFKPVDAAAPRIALPQAPFGAQALAAARAAAGDEPARLGLLLAAAAGITAWRGGLALRAAPSSGALYASEWTVLLRAVGGWQSWHYAPQLHALAAGRLLPAATLAAALGLEPSAEPAGALPPRLLVASALFRRSGHKYRDRTYRYVTADLGHALYNVERVAPLAGLRAQPLLRCDDRVLAAALGLDVDEEGVLALLRLDDDALGAPQAATIELAAPSPLVPLRLASPGLDAAAAPLRLGVTQALQHAASLGRAPTPASQPLAAAPAAAAMGKGPELRLAPPPDAATGEASALPAWLARRRSRRRYAAEPLAQPQLAALLDALRRTALQPAYSRALRAHLLSLHVERLEPAAWMLDWKPPAASPAPGDDALPFGRRSRAYATPAALAELARAAALDQDVAGRAAAIIVLGIDRAALAADPLGAARAYRHAFIEAGRLGEVLYLEAERLGGLGVCSVGAFYDEELAALLALDLDVEWPIHIVCIGVRDGAAGDG
jgi:SagB-type dehydrogenase family enzyme